MIPKKVGRIAEAICLRIREFMASSAQVKGLPLASVLLTQEGKKYSFT